jgi:hypothetical protein
MYLDILYNIDTHEFRQILNIFFMNGEVDFFLFD